MRNDFEQEIRDALRRADSMTIPVRPVDPDEVAALASEDHRARLGSGTVRRVLALAASVVLLAGVGLAGWSWYGRSDTVPAAPSPGIKYMVEVDIYSGRENPELPLDPSIARGLYLMLEDIDAAGLVKPSDPPSLNLGFRGFVVTPSDTSMPVLRILPKTVYSVQGGTYEKFDDFDENFYTRVYHALGPQLPEAVPEARPTTTPTIPNLTAPMPANLGDTATWTLAEPDRVNPASTSFTMDVTRLGCAGGKTGTVLEPTFSISDTQIIIRANVKPAATGGARCPGNNSVPVTLTLDEPIGNRDLLDASCLEGDAVSTLPCAGGSVRWTP
ncbi:MAG: hypothetical protein IT193_19300 [Propionibacteriaceae bacterium]|nr:hypothetical protein [Propionibacteriaceae bacterium]